jgi:DNA-binding transcriptional ArsR family regulator
MKIADLKVEQLENAANMLRAIAHPVRIAILSILEDGSEKTVSEIHTKLNIGQAAASHHLGVLKDKGVLLSRRDGRQIFYTLRHESLRNIIDCISKCTVS